MVDWVSVNETDTEYNELVGTPPHLMVVPYSSSVHGNTDGSLRSFRNCCFGPINPAHHRRNARNDPSDRG